jgi:hypothetical protein
MSFTMGYGGMIESDGTFSISSVTPGDYVIHANLGNGGSDEESGALPITVLGDDLTGLVVTAARATPISGQVVFDGNPPDKLKPSEFMFFMHGTTMGPMSWGNELRTKDDWTLEGKGKNGPLVIDPGRFPEGWTVKAVMLNGADVTESGIPVAPGEPVDGVQVVLTSRIARVTGAVSAENGQPARDYVVVLYGEDASSWRVFSRRVQLARPDQEGRFQAKDLPPGHYLAVALESIEDGQQTDPEFLESMRAYATTFELREGETKTLALKLSARQ